MRPMAGREPIFCFFFWVEINLCFEFQAVRNLLLKLFLRDNGYGTMNLKNYFQSVNQSKAATNVITLPELLRAKEPNTLEIR